MCDKTTNNNNKHTHTKKKKGKKTETVKNPKYVEFLNEYNKLLTKEIELDHPVITKDDLKDAGKTKDQYNILFNLVG